MRTITRQELKEIRSQYNPEAELEASIARISALDRPEEWKATRIARKREDFAANQKTLEKFDRVMRYLEKASLPPASHGGLMMLQDLKVGAMLIGAGDPDEVRLAGIW